MANYFSGRSMFFHVLLQEEFENAKIPLFPQSSQLAIFGLFFKSTYVPTFFATIRKKILDPNGLYINMKFWNSVCNASAAYTSLYRGLKH